MPGESSEPGDGGTGRAVMEATPAFDARTIPEFDGTGNVVEWLEQAALLCELRAVSLMAVLPTRLRGGAFAVWSRMPPETRHHLSSVKAKLLRAFAMDPFTAQAEMTRRHLRPGETADVYLAALQQLAELMGGLPERAIAIVFVNGLPETVQASVRDGLGESFTLEYVLDRARAVLSRATVTAAGPAAAAAAATAAGGPSPHHSDISRLRTKAQSEMLIRRRVAVFMQLVTEYGLAVSVELVPSANNRADELTRVPGEWLKVKPPEAVGVVAAVRTARAEDIQAVHESVGHQGVRRTWWYARRELGSGAVTKSAVRAVVKSCQVCASIDPAPSRWKHGTLEVDRTWERLAMDVTHFRGKTYLTVIDCGPSRYAMWREIRRSDGSEIVGQLESIFLERGAPAELLMDNATEFKGRELKAFAARWDVNLRYRAAYEPGGNGIIERHHRTIKVMATRQGCTVPEAVHRYNVTPKDGCDIASAPVHGVYRQAGRDLCVQSHGGTSVPTARQPGVFQLGDAVWIRKRGDRCTAVSREGTVTKIVSPQTIEVDGVPWHVRNVRHRLVDDATVIATEDEHGQMDNDVPCPVPTVRAPGRLAIEAPATAPTVAPTNDPAGDPQTETGGDVKLETDTEGQGDMGWRGWRSLGREVWTAAGVAGPIEQMISRRPPPWMGAAGVSLALDVGELPLGASAADRRQAAERCLGGLTQCATWIWTDGSAEGGVDNGGAGALVVRPGGEEQELRAPAGRLCSSYRAEMVALATALSWLMDHPEEDPGDPVS
ncbi:Intracisternal A-particle Pol-related polyprotein [Amphibalanus amphitrite]|uniref:Intracisternal A-particle Pol-related polyprotein n=1 Tax=Amphibalanus amphitrite TaxID=1232801 RepID=A0A6A4W4Y5_AMPAM|nr:Intracisternal A-particle Pol-related polyprotein [Amphibalanus amphitrite]